MPDDHEDETEPETESEPLDGTYVAVLDRFEEVETADGAYEEVAVLLVEDDEQIVAERLLGRSELPSDGRHQDAVFELRFEDDELVEMVYDSATTEERSQAAQDRFDRLSRRLPRDETDDTLNE
jgi:hypothetical protein